MISLIIPPKDQISRVSKMLADEFGTASNIKSRVNRLSVLGAITSVQHRLKLYTKGMFCPFSIKICSISCTKISYRSFILTTFEMNWFITCNKLLFLFHIIVYMSLSFMFNIGTTLNLVSIRI